MIYFSSQAACASYADNCNRGTSNIAFDMDDVALVKILSQPEFKIKFESKIDFEASNNIYIQLQGGAVDLLQTLDLGNISNQTALNRDFVADQQPHIVKR